MNTFLQGEGQTDDNYKPVTNGYDPASDRVVWLQTGPAVQDPTTGRWYAPLLMSGGGGGLSTNDGTFAKEAGGNLAGAKTDLDTIVTQTTGLATQATIASVLSALQGTLKTGGVNPSATLTPFQLDGNGNLLINGTNVTYEYTSGGPVKLDGTPTNLSVDRKKNLQGKGWTATVAITTTVAGDLQITFTSAPLDLPASTILYLGGGSNPVEEVYVSDSFVAGTGTVIVPIKNAVVYAGHTNASWSVFALNGPLGNAFSADGVGVNAQSIVDLTATTPNAYTVPSAATQDAAPLKSIPEIALGFLNGSNTIDRVSAAKPLPVTSADGGFVTLGSTTSASYTGSGNTDVIGGLKGLYAALRSLVANAIGYEYNGGNGPTNSNFDLARNMNSKGNGVTVGTLSSGGATGTASLVLTAAPTGLNSNSEVILSDTANTNEEILYVSSVSGSTVNFTTNIVNANAATYTKLSWDTGSVRGPKTGLFTGFGLRHTIGAMWDTTNNAFRQFQSDASGNLKINVASSTNASFTQIVNQTVATQTGPWTSADITGIHVYSQAFFHFRITSLGGYTSVQFAVKRKDSFGNYDQIYTGSAATVDDHADIGIGLATNRLLGDTLQIIMTPSGTPTTGVSFTVDGEAR